MEDLVTIRGARPLERKEVSWDESRTSPSNLHRPRARAVGFLTARSSTKARRGRALRHQGALSLSDPFASSALGRGPLSAAPGLPASPSQEPAVHVRASDQPGTPLAELGWGPPFEAAFNNRLVDGAVPGRVARVDRGALTVLTATGELRALVAAQLAHDPDPLKAPTVGDWVVLQGGLVEEVLPRRSAIVARRRRKSRDSSGARRERRQGVRRLLARGPLQGQASGASPRAGLAEWCRPCRGVDQSGHRRRCRRRRRGGRAVDRCR